MYNRPVIKEYNGDKFTISELLSSLPLLYTRVAVYKGVNVKLRGKPEIIYIIANDINLDSIIMTKNGCIISKQNKINVTTLLFKCWDKLSLNNGQLTGSNMNMMNDNKKYRTYIVCKN